MLTLAILFVLASLAVAWLPDESRAGWPALAVALACGLFGLFQSGTGWGSHFLGDWRGALPLYAGGSAVIVVAFLALGLVSGELRRPDFEDMTFLGWLAHLGWGLAQQGLLLAFLTVAIGPWGAVAVFALLHAPNPFLMAVTIAGGALSVLVWAQAPSVLVAGLAHALTSEVLDGCLSERCTGAMRIGRGYVDWLHGERRWA